MTVLVYSKRCKRTKRSVGYNAKVWGQNAQTALPEEKPTRGDRQARSAGYLPTVLRYTPFGARGSFWAHIMVYWIKRADGLQ